MKNDVGDVHEQLSAIFGPQARKAVTEQPQTPRGEKKTTMSTPNDGLTITRIEAENILKYESFTLSDPGKLTLFRGPNDVGKTTALRLLSLAVKGSSLASQAIIHDGAEEGAIVLQFADGYKLRRSWTQKGQYLQLKDEKNHTVPSAQKWLTERIGEFGDFNPLAWLGLANSESIEDRRRAVAILLRAINVRLAPAEFTQVTGHPTPAGIDFTQHGLIVLDALKEHFATDRKLQNMLAAQKRASATEMRASLPAERPTITDDRRETATRAATRVREKRTDIEIRRLAAKEHGQAVTEIQAAITREEQDRLRIDGEVATLEAEITEIQAKIKRRRGDQFASQTRQDALNERQSKLAETAPPSQSEIEEVQAEILAANKLTQSIIDDDMVIASFAAVDAIDAEANTAALNASVIDTTVKAITGELRQHLLAKAQLPVGSLAIDGEAITVDGHPLANAAESQQIRVALAIARSLSPQLKVIVVDGSERIDARTFDAFLAESRGDGFKYFLAEVDHMAICRTHGRVETARGGAGVCPECGERTTDPPLDIITFGEDGSVSPAVAEVA